MRRLTFALFAAVTVFAQNSESKSKELHFGVLYNQTIKELRTSFREAQIKPFDYSQAGPGEAVYALTDKSIPGLLLIHSWSKKAELKEILIQNPILKDYAFFTQAIKHANNASNEVDLKIMSISWVPSMFIKLSVLTDQYGPYANKTRSSTYVPIRTWSNGVSAFLDESSSHPEVEWKVSRIDYTYVPKPSEALDDPVEERLAQLISEGKIKPLK